jgi:hypothetical protein
MARLTNKDYLLRRKFLQRLWDFDETQKFYSLLTPNKQQSLHLYYVTSNYDLSDEAAIDYRSKRTKGDAFSSGKAFNELYRIVVGVSMRVGLECDYSDLKIFTKKIPQLNKKLRDYYSRKMMERAGKKRAYKNDVRVLSLIRQEIDVDKLAQVMMIAKYMKASKD